MYSDTGNTTSLVLGFPIRTSSDQRSVGSSPRHNAASHVLHRPLMPRHPPCALKHLQSTKPKNRRKITPQQNHQRPHTTPTNPRKGRHARRTITDDLDARNHYPRIKHHTPPPKPVGQQANQPASLRADTPTHPTHSGTGTRAAGLLSQSPIVC
jgi:hypothetical protein